MIRTGGTTTVFDRFHAIAFGYWVLWQLRPAEANAEAFPNLKRRGLLRYKKEDGTLIRDFNRTIQRCEEFYTKLYSTRQARQSSVLALPATYEPPPPILPSEVRVAIKWLKRGKAPGEDNITTAVLQDGGEPSLRRSPRYSTECLSDGRVPSSWKNASVVLIHKKGDTADIKNYWPISLLPVIYKVFSHILLQQMLQALEQHQHQQQPKTRWRDDLSWHLGTTWTRLAQDRHQWKLSREGFLHKGEKW